MRTFLAFVICIIVVIGAVELEKRQNGCPNSCSGHGTCQSGNKCQCDSGYSGDDCSITVIPLGNNKPQQGSVGAKQWNLFSIATTTSLVVIVNQTNSGDCDIYLQRNAIPTRSSYAYRDISMNKNVVLIVDPAGVTTWFIGVYGFLQTDYIITAIVGGSQCADLNECSGNGRCSNGVCLCNQYYMNEDCSIYAPPMALSRTYSNNTLASDTWLYYRLTLNSTNTLRFSVNQFTSGDVDLYVKQNGIPTKTSYDYREIGTMSTFNLDIATPAATTYYIGFRAFVGPVSFSFIATQFVQCPSQCSKHGVCSQSSATCSCDIGFSGQYCQTMTSQMLLGRSYPGFVAENIWNVYKYQSSTSETLVVSINQTASVPNADCDLYVKSGAVPTLTAYDYRDQGFSQRFNLSITNPGIAMWYFGVYGYSTCEYSITLYATVQCPGTPVCSSHGTCSSNGQCICANGYAGNDCSVAVPILSNGITSSGSTTTNGWSFFTISPQLNATMLSINVKELTGVGNLWIYGSAGSFPTLTSFDYSDSTTFDNTSPYHQLTIPFTTPVNRIYSYYIGVYGNPYSQGTIQFKVSAFSPSF